MAETSQQRRRRLPPETARQDAATQRRPGTPARQRRQGRNRNTGQGAGRNHHHRQTQARGRRGRRPGTGTAGRPGAGAERLRREPGDERHQAGAWTAGSGGLHASQRALGQACPQRHGRGTAGPPADHGTSGSGSLNPGKGGGLAGEPRTTGTTHREQPQARSRARRHHRGDRRRIGASRAPHRQHGPGPHQRGCHLPHLGNGASRQGAGTAEHDDGSNHG